MQRYMESKEIYDGVLEFFDVEEFVSPQAYNKYKHLGNYFFLSRIDIRLLAVLLNIRKKLDRPITINDWKWGGKFDERGIRDSSTPMLQGRARKDDPWFSGHCLSMALDFDVEGMTANEVRKWLVDNQECLPFKIRLERKYGVNYISWVHLDVCDDPRNPKVYMFDVK